MACAKCERKVNLPVYSAGSTVTSQFVMSNIILDAAEVESFCIDLEVRNASGSAMTVKRAVRYSDDGWTWDAATPIGSWITSGNYDYGDGCTDIPDGKNYAWIGLAAKNLSGTDVGQGRIIMTIKLAER